MKLDLDALQVVLEEERQSWKLEIGIGCHRPVDDMELRRLDDVRNVKIDRRKVAREKCFGDGCTKKVHSHGYCTTHLTRVRSGLDVDDDTYWSDESRIASAQRARARKDAA